VSAGITLCSLKACSCRAISIKTDSYYIIRQRIHLGLAPTTIVLLLWLTRWYYHIICVVTKKYIIGDHAIEAESRCFVVSLGLLYTVFGFNTGSISYTVCIVTCHCRRRYCQHFFWPMPMSNKTLQEGYEAFPIGILGSEKKNLKKFRNNTCRLSYELDKKEKMDMDIFHVLIYHLPCHYEWWFLPWYVFKVHIIPDSMDVTVWMNNRWLWRKWPTKYGHRLLSCLAEN
jgi:hypothetical protein